MPTHVVDTSDSPYAKLRPVSVEEVELKEGFWAKRIERLRNVTIPSQYELLEGTGRIYNFRRASGREKGDFQGLCFNDSDVYKWVEAAAFLLANSFDEKIRGLVNKVVDDICAAQDEDGYLDTFFSVDKRNQRWTNLRDMHELYCAGHLIQAAIALRRATGDQKLFNTAIRFANHIVKEFGPGGRKGVPGHPEIEMAMIELYRETGDARYLEMAKIFIDNRGKGLLGGGTYFIDHKPFRELDEIIGHAVRSLYLNSGATDLYMETGEKNLWDALERLWNNMTRCKMYVTGGVGSRYEGEAFGFNYELPNVQAYAETCAAIASFMWNWRMLLASGEARFADLMELVLYNGILSGISVDGSEYFYVNPLANRGDHRRQKWFECACCPPNIARLLASLPGYFYSVSGKEIWVNMYDRGVAHLKLNDEIITVTQNTDYPWNGDVEIVLNLKRDLDFILNLRIPGWSEKTEISLNGSKVEEAVRPGSYFKLCKTWKDSDRVVISFQMMIRRISCNPFIYENLGRATLARGPLIYCLEGVDNTGFDVWDALIPNDAPLRAEWMQSLLDGVMVIRGEGYAADSNWMQDSLYQVDSRTKARKVEFLAIPYYAWANRKPSPMNIWLRSIPESDDSS
ncbi:MAG: glycoside hydrolase family 127 protein [Thermoproteota archaeon]